MKLAEAVLREVVDFKVEEDRFQVSQPSSVMSTVMPEDQSVVLPRITCASLQRCLSSESSISMLSVGMANISQPCSSGLLTTQPY